MSNKQSKDENKDDFEDYEDDFEADSDEEKSKNVEPIKVVTNGTAPKPEPSKFEPPIIQPTVVKEEAEKSILLQRMANRRASGGGNIHKVEKPKDPPPRISSANRKINFANARESGYVQQQPNWLTHFQNIIKFETVTQQVAEVVPLSSYEYYIQLFGKGNRNQTSCQTGDDHTASSTQTEGFEQSTVWTQFPPSDNLGLGWGRNFDEQKQTEKVDYSSIENIDITDITKINDERFSQFVSIAGKLILNVISSTSERTEAFHLGNKTKHAFSSGFEIYKLEIQNTECRVSATTVRGIQGRHTVMAAYYVKSSDVANIVGKTVIIEHNLKDPTEPFMCLFADNEVTSLAYGPLDSPVICAGLIDGSVIAFDTAEPEYWHTKNSLPWPGFKNGMKMRTPSYDTSFESCNSETKLSGSPVIWIVTIGEETNFSFQLITMTQRGIITVYNVTETANNSSIIGADFGIYPNSRIRLTKINVITTAIPSLRSNILSANCMVVNPRNIYQILVATNDGSIANYTRAGLSNGNIVIYRVEQCDPILTLVPPNSSKLSVTFVEWSPTTSHILYSIHGGERLLVWDIATGKSPLHICDLQSEYQSRVISMIVWRTEQNIGVMGLGLANGNLLVHSLERLVVPREDDLLEIVSKFQKNV
uniref:Uncharacterized protein n=1 Tax=Panagrolaimus superbus TaxID=310955 RepID=A0A914YI56_9BILA